MHAMVILLIFPSHFSTPELVETKDIAENRAERLQDVVRCSYATNFSTNSYNKKPIIIKTTGYYPLI